MDLLSFCNGLGTSLLADKSKAYGGVFAVVKMCRLLGMSMLGGMVVVGDLRLLKVLLKYILSEQVIENTQEWFTVALIVVMTSGIFMSSAVAMKLYYNQMFWAKMTSLALGVTFVYAIRRPLLKFNHDTISPWTIKLLAVTSISIWFTVAASGRWIGFS